MQNHGTLGTLDDYRDGKVGRFDPSHFPVPSDVKIARDYTFLFEPQESRPSKAPDVPRFPTLPIGAG